MRLKRNGISLCAWSSGIVSSIKSSAWIISGRSDSGRVFVVLRYVSILCGGDPHTVWTTEELAVQIASEVCQMSMKVWVRLSSVLVDLSD